jgi:hypothetical protein
VSASLQDSTDAMRKGPSGSGLLRSHLDGGYAPLADLSLRCVCATERLVGLAEAAP